MPVTAPRITVPLACSILVVVAGAAGCKDGDASVGSLDSGTPDWGTLEFTEGLILRGPACVPVFDHCEAREVALLGGGCKRVGPPTTCLAGWKLVKGGWCEPVRPQSSVHRKNERGFRGRGRVPSRCLRRNSACRRSPESVHRKSGPWPWTPGSRTLT